MAKIEIIHQHLQPAEQNVLDIYQLQMISMYEEVANGKNVFEHLQILNANGYVLFFEQQNGNLRFTGCDSKYHGFNGNQNIHEQFEWNLILMVKSLLKDWHTKRLYEKNGGRFWQTNDPEMVSIMLTRKQRGVLTKILKIENKRKKRLLVR